LIAIFAKQYSRGDSAIVATKATPTSWMEEGKRKTAQAMFRVYSYKGVLVYGIKKTEC
jgi:hypothetical protein